MVQVTDSLAALPQDLLSLFYTTDPLLGNVPIIAFHGPSTTGNSTLNSSRIQLHIFSAAGFETYPRLTISPNSPFYNAVEHLPRDQQGDEISRGLAFGLLKYFQELPEVVKTSLIVQSAHTRTQRPGSAPTLFGESHAASLAAAMVPVENMVDVIRGIEASLQLQVISHIDVDVVLPPGTIQPLKEDEEQLHAEDDADFDASLHIYGQYAPLVKLFGDASFLPTSRLRRAPSKASSLNRTKSFLKEQKLSLRREMSELVDTEERYVSKIYELVNHMVDEFRVKARSRASGSSSPTEEELRKLFPPSLDKILAINSAFLSAVQSVMNDTEEDAMQDFEADQLNFKPLRYGENGKLRDPTGAVAFAKTLLEWFPQFTDCYQDYIRSSQDFPSLITSYTAQQSSFSQRVQQTGEQRLRSAVIEPVQRLPRYSLFIDNIVNYLPLTHPALQTMLKARDVITAICSMDPPASDASIVVNRLRGMIGGWPSAFDPHGRLIAAVDFIELPPPFYASANPPNAKHGILLLFADTVVVVHKTRSSSLSARGLVAEVDKPTAAQMIAALAAGAGGGNHVFDLSLATWHALSETRFSESNSGRVTYMTSIHSIKKGAIADANSTAASVNAYLLQGSYDGKASKWTEDVTKARIEARFSETERESDAWCLRHVNLVDNGLNIYAAVFEEGIDKLIDGRKEPAPVRVVVDHQKGTKGAPVGHYSIEIVANVKTVETSALSYHLEVMGLLGRVHVDDVNISTFMPVFAKRIGDFLRSHYGPGNPTLTTGFISYYTAVLKAISFQLGGIEPLQPKKERPKSFRAPSPVKMLSSFLNSGGSMSGFSGNARQPRTPILGTVPFMTPSTLSRANSKVSESDQDIQKTPSRGGTDDALPANNLIRLEETFTGYLAALLSRKGNVVGKVLRSRNQADELQVNALYNSFIENPFDIRTSSESTFDVLFCAFEKYLKIAWRDQMGAVITMQELEALQEKNAKLYAGDFADFIKMVFVEMAPQNKRAFIGIIKLLAELLDGCGNDGDRGALTAAFADLLVHEGDPHNFINLLDRLVEDSDHLFEDVGPVTNMGYATPYFGSINSTSRSKTGSLTSNTSSFRKRFGFDNLLRQNSKSDNDRPSMWRTLNKTNRNPAGESASSSLSKASALGRSRSTDTDSRSNSPRRPGSRDRPTVLGAFDERPSSSHMEHPNRLSVIQASPPPETAGAGMSIKKKRRSSLSDLKALMQSATLDSPSSPTSTRRALPMPQRSFNSSPRTPSPIKGSIMNRTIKYGQDSPNQKENSPLGPRQIRQLTERPQNIMSGTDEVIIKDLWTPNGHSKAHKPSVSMSNIPVLIGGTRDRTPSSSYSARPHSTVNAKTSPQKLKLQNPQKLRERLEREAKAIASTNSALEAEMSKIGEEMSKMGGASPILTLPSANIEALRSSVKSLESRIPVMIRELSSQNDSIRADVETSLHASESKVKALDQLYKEASAENELLYEKFNGELGKIVKALKGKGKEDKEELVVKVKEASEEAAKLKKENSRLRREAVTMRTLLKSYE